MLTLSKFVETIFGALLLDSDSFGKRHSGTMRASTFRLPVPPDASFIHNAMTHHPERIPKPRYIPAQLIFSYTPASAGRN